MASSQTLLNKCRSLILNRAYPDALEFCTIHASRDPGLLPDLLLLLYRQLLMDSDNHRLKILIAKVCVGQGLYQDAFYELADVVDENPDSHDAYLLLSRMYSKNGCNAQIQALFEHAFDNAIYDPSVLELLSNIYLETHDLEKGIRFYERLIELNPASTQYFKPLSQLYKAQGRPEMASGVLLELAKKSPACAYDCSEIVRQVVQDYPGCLESRSVLIQLLFMALRPCDAHHQIQELVRYSPTSLNAALRWYKMGLDRYPNTPELLIGMADILIALQEYSEAVFMLKQLNQNTYQDSGAIMYRLKTILMQFPDQILACLFLATLLFESDRSDEALVHVDHLLNREEPPLDDMYTQLKLHLEKAALNSIRAQLCLARLAYLRQDYPTALNYVRTLYHTSADLEARVLAANISMAIKLPHSAIRLLFSALTKYPDHYFLYEKIRGFHDRLLEKGIEIKLGPLKNKKVPQLNEYQLGLLYLRNGEALKALEKFQGITEAGPLRLKSQMIIGRCFMEMDRFDLSTNHYLRLLPQLSPNDAACSNAIRYLLSISLINSGKLIQALDHLNIILEKDVNFSRIQDLLKRYKDRSISDSRAKAVSACMGATKPSVVAVDYSEPHATQSHSGWNTLGFSYTHNNQGVDFLIQENMKAAEDAFQLALQMDPQLSVASCNLALVSLLKNQPERAHYFLDQAESMSPRLDVVFLNRGLAYAHTHQIDEAVTQFQKAIELNPDNALAHLNLGDIFYQQQHVESALNCWRASAKSEHLFYLIAKRVRHLDPRSLGFSYWVLNPSSNIAPLNRE